VPGPSGLYGLIDGASEGAIGHARMGADARGVLVNDAFIDHSAFVLAGIPRANRGVVRPLDLRERGIDLGPMSEQCCGGVLAGLSLAANACQPPALRTSHTDERSTTIVKHPPELTSIS
jgi:hypothetical protein